MIAELYARKAGTVQRLVAGRARVPEAVVEDACQTAWERLWSHEDVSLHPAVAVRWLVVTATRVAWRHSRRRELPAGSWQPHDEDGYEEPTGEAADPLDVAIERERSRELAGRLEVLTDRERRFLVMRAVGMSYREIGERTGATLRTVERQIVRGRRKLRERSL
jgi:RNA polymerase sigma factor (sigma-70 family)